MSANKKKRKMTSAIVSIRETADGKIEVRATFHPSVKKDKDGAEIPHPAGRFAVEMLKRMEK